MGGKVDRLTETKRGEDEKIFCSYTFAPTEHCLRNLVRGGLTLGGTIVPNMHRDSHANKKECPHFTQEVEKRFPSELNSNSAS